MTRMLLFNIQIWAEILNQERNFAILFVFKNTFNMQCNFIFVIKKNKAHMTTKN